MMGRTSAAHEMKGSPAPSIRGSTPSNTRRSSSRAPRKATQELDSNSYQPSRSAYSLPTTPIISSFEDSASSKLRRRRRSLSYSEKPSEPNALSGTSSSKHTADLSDVPNSVSKKRRSRTRDTTNGDAASTTASDISRAPTPTSFSVKSNGQPEQPRSVVRLTHSGTAASQTERTGPAQSGPNSKESTPAPSASLRRKHRKPMPEKINGARSGTSTPRSATPQPSRKDWEPKAVSQQTTQPSVTPHTKAPPTPAPAAGSRTAKNNALERANLATPAEKSSRSTPDNRSSTRIRRRNRQSTATPTSSDKAKGASDDADSLNAESASKDSTDAESTNKPRKSNMVTLTLSRKALESVLARSKPMEQLPVSPEIADSVEATPVHLYDNSFHFDYDTEMYRNNYGLDGKMDTPASPTSFSTTTSAAARTSGRTRKPTIRVLESLESERKFRRNRTRTPKPSGEGTQLQRSNRAKSTQPSDPASGQPTPAPHPAQQLDVAELARRLVEMASTAVRPDSAPDKKAEAWLKELRAKYRSEKAGRNVPNSLAGDAGKPGGESMPSPPDHPSHVGNAASSWTDEDGWTHAGQFNEFGEELLGIPEGYTWVRPNNTYGDDALPQPPIRLKSREQIEKDRIYGFPPRIGERNLPRDMDSPFFVENVDEERAKIKAREEARKRGIATNRSMSLGDIEALIAQHDSPAAPQASNVRSLEAKDRKDAKPKESRKRRRRTDPVVEENLNGSVPETPDDSRPKRRRKTVTGTSAPSPAPQPTPASKPKPTPRSRNRVKEGKESKAGSDAVKVKKTMPEPPKTKEKKPESALKIKKIKTAAETPKTQPSKDTSGSTKGKVEMKAAAPPAGHNTGGTAVNDAGAPKKRRRRHKQPLLKLRLIGPKKEDENGPNKGGEPAQESKKRPHSEVESDGAEQRARKSPKRDEPKPWPQKIKFKKPSPEKSKPKPEVRLHGAPSTPETPSASRENPSAAESQQNETPSGRPRRAAAAAMMAGSKQNAEERARKARRRSRKSTGKEANAGTDPEPVSTRNE